MQSVHLLPGVVLPRDAQGRLCSAAQLRRAGFRISTAVLEADPAETAREPHLDPATSSTQKIDISRKSG